MPPVQELAPHLVLTTGTPSSGTAILLGGTGILLGGTKVLPKLLPALASMNQPGSRMRNLSRNSALLSGCVGRSDGSAAPQHLAGR